MSESNSNDPSSDTGNTLGEPEYRIVTRELLLDGTIPREAAIDLTLTRGEEQKAIRPLKATIHYDDVSLEGLNSDNREVYIPFSKLPGFYVLGSEEIDQPPLSKVVSFTYFKQQTGAEPTDRILNITGVGYGVHPNHLGVLDSVGNVEIPPEKPGWYLIGDQIGTINLNTGEVLSDIVGERAFPLARIVEGPLGDPATNADHREKYGIY